MIALLLRRSLATSDSSPTADLYAGTLAGVLLFIPPSSGSDLSAGVWRRVVSTSGSVNLLSWVTGVGIAFGGTFSSSAACTLTGPSSCAPLDYTAPFIGLYSPTTEQVLPEYSANWGGLVGSAPTVMAFDDVTGWLYASAPGSPGIYVSTPDQPSWAVVGE